MTDLKTEYINDRNEQLLLSYHVASGGIMVSRKDTNGEYHMIFHAHGTKNQFTKTDDLINWYNNQYKPLQTLINGTAEFCRVSKYR